MSRIGIDLGRYGYAPCDEYFFQPSNVMGGIPRVSVRPESVKVLLKLGTGILTGSLGLISAGIESSGDVIAAVLTFFAIRLGGRPAGVEDPPPEGGLTSLDPSTTCWPLLLAPTALQFRKCRSAMCRAPGIFHGATG